MNAEPRHVELLTAVPGALESDTHLPDVHMSMYQGGVDIDYGHIEQIRVQRYSWIIGIPFALIRFRPCKQTASIPTSLTA